MKKLVVLTGAGISAESGINTFRDSDGLWEGHDVMAVATPEGFAKNPKLVLDFYNQRRQQLKTVQPNLGHHTLVQLEKHFNVNILTQNVDNLHEKAGSTAVLHLHGELLKARSTANTNLIFHWENDINIGDLATDGSQLRPHIVWFGEEVPAIEQAIQHIKQADFVAVIGTSMQVYPAAGILRYAKSDVPIFYIDPKPAKITGLQNPLEIIAKKATEGIAEFKEKLLLQL